MEDTKIIEPSVDNVVPEVEIKSEPKARKNMTSRFVLGIILAIVVVGSLVYFLIKKDSTVDLIDNAITSIETLLSGTDDIDTELSDLPDNFLDSETVLTEDIDSSISELDEQIEELDGLEDDFGLEDSDVGLD